MAELKTKKNDKDVRAFLEAVEHKKRKEDSLKLFEMMNEAIGTSPNMWGGIQLSVMVHIIINPSRVRKAIGL